eukprot:GAHX01007576.1.p1 GENE.GAHX01007576.1~~GAHX01007576.1.p1  ORF type:complete len:64 (-),score=6.22 GAHX01007576.1:77-268(-)
MNRRKNIKNSFIHTLSNFYLEKFTRTNTTFYGDLKLGVFTSSLHSEVTKNSSQKFSTLSANLL